MSVVATARGGSGACPSAGIESGVEDDEEGGEREGERKDEEEGADAWDGVGSDVSGADGEGLICP